MYRRNEYSLIVDLVIGRIDEEQFCSQMGVGVLDLPGLGLELLEDACSAEDPVGVEVALHLGHKFGFLSDHLTVLRQLAFVEWHRRHEDIMDALAVMKSTPSVVELICNMAAHQYRYREYDDGESLVRKAVRYLVVAEAPESVACLCALAHARSGVLRATAVAALRQMASHDDEAIAALAREALASVAKGIRG